MKEFDSLNFRECAKKALAVSSAYIRGAILGEIDLKEYLTKGDKTAVTIVDMESQRLAHSIIKRDLGEFKLNQEETKGESGNLSSNITLYHDPLDGTGGFLIGGPTPTVILGAYNSKLKKVLACATMEPSTGRFWFSSLGDGAFLNRFDYENKKWESEDGKQIHVNNASIKGGHILVDVTHPFKRLGGEREIYTKEGRRELTNILETLGAKEASFYTNGGHYALVATGRPSLVGNITTAIGGPFDIAGLRHVLEAGGSAGCYRIEKNRNIKYLGEDIENADIVISANNHNTFKILESAVANSIHF